MQSQSESEQYVVGIVTKSNCALIRQNLAKENTKGVGQLEDLLNFGLDRFTRSSAELVLFPGPAFPFDGDWVELFGFVFGV